MDEEMQEKFFELFKNIHNDIERNTDHREKIAGDRVKVWDGSANVDDKGRSRNGIDPLFKKIAILVKTDCDKSIVKRGYLGVEDKIEVLDAELYFPDDDITVWTKTKYLQLADFEPLPE